MAIPDYETLMLPLLRRLASGEQHVRELSQSLAEEFTLTDEERTALIPSGRGVTVMHSRTGWAKTYLKAAGLVEQPRRGWVQITERGREVLRAPPARLDNAFLMQFAEFKAFRFPSENGVNDADEALTRQAARLDGPYVAKPGAEPSVATSPEERLDLAIGELRTALAADLLSRVHRLDPTMFEQVIVDLLVRMGYGGNRADAARRIGRTGDGGIDGVIREDRLGLDVIYIQAKRYAAENSVGSPEIRAFAGALLEHGATKGVFVTTGRFTPSARDAASIRSHKIVLIDGEELARLLIEHEVGVRTVQTVHIQRIDLDAYEDDEG